MESESGSSYGFQPADLEAPDCSRGKYGRRARRLTCTAGLFLMLAPAWGQSPQTINVYVVPTQQPVVQGPSALDAADLQLRSAEFAIYRDHNAARYDNNVTSGSAVGDHFSLLRFYAPAFALAAAGDHKLGAAFDKLNLFGDVSYRFGQHQLTGLTPAYGVDTESVFVGTDYRLQPHLVIGAAGGLLNRDNDFTDTGGSMNLQSKSATLLMNWTPGQSWYVDGIARYARLDYDIRRNNGGTGLHANTSGNSFTLSSGLGYNWSLGALTLIPRTRIIYKNVSIDGYRESGGVRYGHQSLDSIQSQLGGAGTYVFNTNFGVLLPQLDAEWVHEFKHQRRFITGANRAGTLFAIPVAALDRNFFRIALGTTAILAHDRIFFMRYEVELGRAHIERNTLVLGMRFGP